MGGWRLRREGTRLVEVTPSYEIAYLQMADPFRQDGVPQTAERRDAGRKNGRAEAVGVAPAMKATSRAVRPRSSSVLPSRVTNVGRSGASSSLRGSFVRQPRRLRALYSPVRSLAHHCGSHTVNSADISTRVYRIEKVAETSPRRSDMGQTEPRHWDERTYTSRPARPDDPPRSVFHAYVPHPIRDWTPDLSALTWDLVSAATQRCRELQRSDAHGPLPAEWLLSRAESIASSTIEEIRPSARSVARAEAQLRLFGEQPPEVEMQALRNIRITQHARDVADSGAEMSIDLLRRLHATLMGDDDPIAGQLRDRQNWVGAGALGGPLRARHVGPPAELVPELLDDLAAFANRADDGFPLVRAALAHAQFETIHPFPDGNGRTGRAVLQYMYAREGMSEGAALPVSSALMLAKTDYFDALVSCLGNSLDI